MRGFSLIELVITLAILAILLGLSASSYSIWIANVKIRSTAEAIQNGLQLARGEAVRRNARINFQLVSTVGNDCALSLIIPNWVVSYDDPSNMCAFAPLNEAYPITDSAHNPAPRIIQSRSAAEGSQNVVIAADQSVFVFNGLGRLAVLPGVNPVKIDVQNPSAGTCVVAGGKIRCLRITVTVGGQIRMCDPQLTLTRPSDPQSC